MKKDDFEREQRLLVSLAHGSAYRAFGFGSQSIEFARQLIKLGKTRPFESELIADIANRIEFIDYLRFELGWQVSGENETFRNRTEGNFDALEIYLLCTCIDALANSEKWARFDKWVEENPTEVEKELKGRTLSPEDIAQVVSNLHESFRLPGRGLTRNFVKVFEDLPGYLKSFIANSFAFIRGDLLGPLGRKKVKGWHRRSELNKVRTIASDYLYDLRRSGYTHLCRIETALDQGRWRRSAIARGIPELLGSGEGWRTEFFYKPISPEETSNWATAKKDQAVEYSIGYRASIKEGFLLRAVIVTTVLWKILRFLPSKEFFESLLNHYEELEIVYAFIFEMQRNKDYVDYLVSGMFEGERKERAYLLTTNVAEQVLSAAGKKLQGLETYVRGYLRYTCEINELVQQNTPKGRDWSDMKSFQREFAGAIRSSHALGMFYHHFQFISDNLRRQARSGVVNWGSTECIIGWPVAWRRLREGLSNQPRCMEHPEHPCLGTLARDTKNDVIEVSRDEIVVRSHQSFRERRLPESLFEAWWDHLVSTGSASLAPRDANVPRSEHSRIVGAIMAVCLPDLVRVVDQGTIELINWQCETSED